MSDRIQWVLRELDCSPHHQRSFRVRVIPLGDHRAHRPWHNRHGIRKQIPMAQWYHASAPGLQIRPGNFFFFLVLSSLPSVLQGKRRKEQGMRRDLTARPSARSPAHTSCAAPAAPPLPCSDRRQTWRPRTFPRVQAYRRTDTPRG